MNSENVGAPLKVLVRAYHSAVSPTVENFPDGPRGYQLLEAAISSDRPNQLSLATTLGLDKTRTTYLIDRLVADGLIVREADPQDRRVKRIVPTAKGLSEYQAASLRVSEAESEVLSPLSDEEQQLFRGLLSKLHATHCGREEQSGCVFEETPSPAN